MELQGFMERQKIPSYFLNVTKDFRHPLYLYVNLYLSATSLLAQYLHQYQSYEYVGSPQNRAFQSSG